MSENCEVFILFYFFLLQLWLEIVSKQKSAQRRGWFANMFCIKMAPVKSCSSEKPCCASLVLV